MTATSRDVYSFTVLFLASLEFDQSMGSLRIKSVGQDRQVPFDEIAAGPTIKHYGSLICSKVNAFWIFHLDLSRAAQAKYRAVCAQEANVLKLYMLDSSQLSDWHNVRGALPVQDLRDGVVGLGLQDISGRKGKYVYEIYPAGVGGFPTSDLNNPMWIVQTKTVLHTFEQKTV